MDLTKYVPKNLRNLRDSDFSELTIADIEVLAKQHPFMNGDLLIQKSDGSGVKSPATYKSFLSLIKSGHKFKIVGTRFGDPKLPPVDFEPIVEKASEPEFIPFPTTEPAQPEIVKKRAGRPKKVIS